MAKYRIHPDFGVSIEKKKIDAVREIENDLGKLFLPPLNQRVNEKLSPKRRRMSLPSPGKSPLVVASKSTDGSPADRMGQQAYFQQVGIV